MSSSTPPLSPPTERRTKTRSKRILPAACATLLLAVAGLTCAGCLSVTSEATGQQTRERRVNNQPMESTNNSTDSAETPETKVEKESRATPRAPVSFYTALDGALSARKLELAKVCDLNDPVSRRVLEDYGALYVAASTVQPPPVCMFTSDAEVSKFQSRAGFTTAIVGGDPIDLQPAAMQALLSAREEARASGLDITPRGGSEAARRSYDDTLRLWNTRFLPALSYWSRLGRLTKEQVARLKALPLKEQVREVLELERDGIYFSKDFSKSILYSIAAPGTSQHLAMLALDVDQFADERVRRILARHGWFQTVKSDLPHFTYLGLEEKELPAHGLRSVKFARQLFWIPNVE